ncbi:unnamed protein product [Pipistrellus nathusii]|uniref:Uncharacterized protein n=1 Tax=Pipistrellus nathusii TaxID=59473 RepID=A0ABN9ZZD1_PIPNA
MYLGCGHIPSRGGVQEAVDQCFLSSMFLTLYPSLFLSVKKSIKYIFFKKYLRKENAFRERKKNQGIISKSKILGVRGDFQSNISFHIGSLHWNTGPNTETELN